VNTRRCQTVLAVSMLWAAMSVTSPAQTLTALADFTGRNGGGPLGPLVQGADGNFYGTGSFGGTNCAPVGCGTVFRMTPAGAMTVLYNFCSLPACTDGSYPYSGLIQATDGNFYGTTWQGGANGQYGTVFKITQTGRLTTLYSFCKQASCSDGELPQAPLVQGSDGNLYGTTTLGGQVCRACGTVFKITLKGVFTSLHSFDGISDGSFPKGGLMQAPNGLFYGTTANGGPVYDGTVFSMTPAGKLTTLHTFDGYDGGNPWGTLVLGPDGALYGTTVGGYGTVFKMTLTNQFTSIYNFCSLPQCEDGINPESGLTLGTDGNFYGTLNGATVSGMGSVFQITASGILTTVYQFCPTGYPVCPQGATPVANPIQATNGKFYGATTLGGDLSCSSYGDGCGIVFSLDTGLGPFVSFVRNSAKVGQNFGILGYNIRGTTAVMLNGTPVSFAVRSNTLITATVPAGANSGFVTVSTPGGMLTSNVAFNVVP